MAPIRRISPNFLEVLMIIFRYSYNNGASSGDLRTLLTNIREYQESEYEYITIDAESDTSETPGEQDVSVTPAMG